MKSKTLIFIIATFLLGTVAGYGMERFFGQEPALKEEPKEAYQVRQNGSYQYITHS